MILHETRWVSIPETSDFDTVCTNCGALTDQPHDDEQCSDYRAECARADQWLDFERALDFAAWEEARAVAEIDVALELGGGA